MSNVDLLNGSVLAYMGDAYWSLIVREYLIDKGFTKAKDLQKESVNYVSAKAQARFIHEFEDMFDAKDLEIFKRGRNYKSTSVPKNTDVSTYRISTGFEAVVGYWYLTKQETKLTVLWNKVKTLMEE